MADLGIVGGRHRTSRARAPGSVDAGARARPGDREQQAPHRPNCAARTVIKDIEPIVRISQEIGIAIEAATFIGSSPIRQYTEDWTLERMLQVSEEAVSFAVKEGPAGHVRHRRHHARPARNSQGAVQQRHPLRSPAPLPGRHHRARHAGRSPATWSDSSARRSCDPSGEAVKIDWHGHRDRGLGIANCLAAIEAGVDRVHAHGTRHG